MVNVFAVPILIFFLPVFATPIIQRNAGDIEAAMNIVDKKLSTLIDSVHSFSVAPTLILAAELHPECLDLQDAVANATVAIQKTGTLPLLDATVILEHLKALEPRIISVLRLMAVEKTEFENLPLDPAKFVRIDLTKLHITCLTFSIDIINACPEPLKAQATAIKNEIDTQFVETLNAYSDD